MFRRYVFGHLKGNLSPGLQSALIAYWKLDINSNDASGNGHDGVDTNIAYTTGKINNAASFNGSTSVITVPDSDAFSFNSGSPDKPFSVSFWLGGGDYPAIYGVMSKGNNVSDLTNEWSLLIWSNWIYFYCFDKTNSGAQMNAYGPFGYSPNWRHCVLTYDGSGSYSGVNFYTNTTNHPLSNGTSGTYTGMKNTNRPLTIGMLGSSGLPFNNKLDEIAIFNRVITTTEIAELYNGGNGKTL